MDKEVIIAQMNKMRPPFLDLIGCTIEDVDPTEGTCTMIFNITEQLCHSGNIVQGGFITAMLDTVSSHAVFGCNNDVTALATLDLRVNFYKASHPGRIRAVGKIEKLTRNIAFLSAELFNEEGERTASLSASAKVSRKSESKSL